MLTVRRAAGPPLSPGGDGPASRGVRAGLPRGPYASSAFIPIEEWFEVLLLILAILIAGLALAGAILSIWAIDLARRVEILEDAQRDSYTY